MKDLLLYARIIKTLNLEISRCHLKFAKLPSSLRSISNCPHAITYTNSFILNIKRWHSKAKDLLAVVLAANGLVEAPLK